MVARRTSTKPANCLRIIAGQWRGRKLSFPEVPGIRPTPDRVRETLFNWLQPVIPGARCLDLFSGSGALAFEALSRGAAQVTALEYDATAARGLRDNAALLRCENLRLVPNDALRYLQAPATARFDVVFLDPPFGQGLLAPCCRQLECGGWLAARAYIYLEAERGLEITDIPDNWIVRRSKQAGRVGYHLALRQAADSVEVDADD